MFCSLDKGYLVYLSTFSTELAGCKRHNKRADFQDKIPRLQQSGNCSFLRSEVVPVFQSSVPVQRFLGLLK